MVKNILPAISIIFLLASCSSLKPLNFTSNKQVISSSVTNNDQARSNLPAKTSPKFIDNITVTPETAEPPVASEPVSSKKEAGTTRRISVVETTPEPAPSFFGDRSSVIESASSLQLKYSVLLNTEVEQLQNHVLLEKIDEWYGTRYRMGGTTKKGVDCSAFVQSVIAGAFGLAIPRTAREQYRVAKLISRTELKEGDLLFFNTRGGVSHVGIYLQNNKFVHASVSQGVTISDMFEPYYLQRFIGAGRLENSEASLSAAN
jgi:cell wall-associated NlpC family hydrolase